MLLPTFLVFQKFLFLHQTFCEISIVLWRKRCNKVYRRDVTTTYWRAWQRSLNRKTISPSLPFLRHLCAPLRYPYSSQTSSPASLRCGGVPRQSSVIDGRLLRGNSYLFSVKGWIDYKSEPTQFEGLKVGRCGCRSHSSCRGFNEVKESSRIESVSSSRAAFHLFRFYTQRNYTVCRHRAVRVVYSVRIYRSR
jgi:hypothetical protein